MYQIRCHVAIYVKGTVLPCITDKELLSEYWHAHVIADNKLFLKIIVNNYPKSKSTKYSLIANFVKNANNSHQSQFIYYLWGLDEEVILLSSNLVTEFNLFGKYFTVNWDR